MTITVDPQKDFCAQEEQNLMFMKITCIRTLRNCPLISGNVFISHILVRFVCIDEQDVFLFINLGQNFFLNISIFGLSNDKHSLEIWRDRICKTIQVAIQNWHSSVGQSVPTILWPRVQILSTTCFFNLYLIGLWVKLMKKAKEAAIGSYWKNCKNCS